MVEPPVRMCSGPMGNPNHIIRQARIVVRIWHVIQFSLRVRSSTCLSLPMNRWDMRGHIHKWDNVINLGECLGGMWSTTRCGGLARNSLYTNDAPYLMRGGVSIYIDWLWGRWGVLRTTNTMNLAEANTHKHDIPDEKFMYTKFTNPWGGDWQASL
jgi:hypothetical protein